jgi:alcohol dehydrogenase
MPTALCYDPDLFGATPIGVLAGSAINGFDKGVEAIYSRFANPMTDSTAVRGLRYLRSSLPELRDADDPAVMERAVMGTILVQYGVSIPDAYKINVVHAFGHALRNEFGIQQGIAHAVVVPYALRLIFEEGGGRPDVLAEGLVLNPDPGDVESAVVDAAVDVRDGLGLPSRLRDVEGTSEDRLRAAAERTANDALLDLGPPTFEPSVEDLEATLREAW